MTESTYWSDRLRKVQQDNDTQTMVISPKGLEALARAVTTGLIPSGNTMVDVFKVLPMESIKALREELALSEIELEKVIMSLVVVGINIRLTLIQQFFGESVKSTVQELLFNMAQNQESPGTVRPR